MKHLPAYLNKYFWDVSFEKIDLDRSRTYVLKRVLEYGDEKAVQWMWDHYKRSEVTDALCRFRGYSRKTANFWALILNLPRRKVLCLQKRYLRTPKTIWNH